jgi:hypothetical protein
MASWGFFEYMRQQAEALKHQQTARTVGSNAAILMLEIEAARDLP